MLWTVSGEISQDGRADLKVRSFRKGQRVLPHPIPVFTPSSGISSGICLSSHNTGRKLSFYSVLVFCSLSDFLQLMGSDKANTGTREVAGACSWRQEVEVGLTLPAAASC